jgi:hypothetical protein
VFEVRVLSRILGPKKGEVTGEWREIHNELLNDQYSSPNFVRVLKIKKNEMVWAWIADGREERCTQGFGGET